MTDHPKQLPPNSAGHGLFGWLGRQVGHIKKAIKADVTTTQPAIIYRDTQIREQPLPSDPSVKLRRTVIDEVVVQKNPPPSKST